MADLINYDLEKNFSAAEIATIKKFVGFVADFNRQSEFSIGETDDEIKAEVREWLERRYRAGHGKRRD